MKEKSTTTKFVFIIVLSLIMITSIGGLFTVPYFDPQIKYEKERARQIAVLDCIPKNEFPEGGSKIYLEMYENGNAIPVPKGIGASPTCTYDLSTINGSGTILAAGDSLEKKQLTLGTFFALWGIPVSEVQLGNAVVDQNHILTMSVDGTPTRDFGSLQLKDGQHIRIEYTSITEDVSADTSGSNTVTATSDIPPEVLEQLKEQMENAPPSAEPGENPEQ
jgi:hypothetical protein